MNPLNAPLRFRLRTLTNIGIVLGAFIPMVVILTMIMSAAIADVVSIAAAFYFYFFVMAGRAIGIRCNHCHKYISTNTPWVCGYCQEKNEKVDEFPFVYRCEHCGAEPKAYKCHHCKKTIFLAEDQLEANAAQCFTVPVVVPKEPDEASLEGREKRKAEHRLDMARLTAKHDLLMVRLSTELDEIKRKGEFTKKQQRTPQEKIEEDFSKFFAGNMAAYDIARREKAANEEKYKDDPYLLERANESIDSWLKQQL